MYLITPPVLVVCPMLPPVSWCVVTVRNSLETCPLGVERPLKPGCITVMLQKLCFDLVWYAGFLRSVGKIAYFYDKPIFTHS